MENADAYLTADVSKINEDDDSMKILMEEEQETVKYQNTLKLDVKNISKNQKKYGYQNMKLFMLHFLDFCKIIQINLSLYHMVSK